MTDGQKSERQKLSPSQGSETTLSATQRQAQSAFGFKWNQKLDTKEFDSFYVDWLVGKYFQGDRTILEQWLEGENRLIVEVGCGAGHSAICLFGEYLARHRYLGFDISTSVNVARQRFSDLAYEGTFINADLLRLPIQDGVADLILAEGVLHHTDSTAGAIMALSRKVRVGGRLIFYVYARKGPIREFTDDHIRHALSDLTDEQAWEAIKPLTKLGIALGGLNAEVNIPEDIPYLGIKAGKLSVQRLFYWHVAKMFFRPDLTFDEMHLINFDWYRPLNCHRHTPEEVQRYCEEAGLRVERMGVEPAGITVISERI